MSDDHRRPLTDLIFLARAHIVVQALSVLIAASASAVVGVVLARLQLHFASELLAGAHPQALAALVGRGSNAATAAAPWAAAALFALALLRLRREPLEPAMSLRPVEQQTPAQLRRGLRREYAVIRGVLVVLLLVSAADAARLLSLLTGGNAGRLAGRGGLIAAAAETLGLCAASGVLAAWARRFARMAGQLGAL